MPAMITVLRNLSDRVAKIRREGTGLDTPMRELTATVETQLPSTRVKPDRRQYDRRKSSTQR